MIPSYIKSAIMKQKADSQEKQNANETGQYEPQDHSGDGLRPSERSVGARAVVPARFEPVPLEACLDYAATYDPNVNYSNVIASVLLLLAARDAERTGGQVRPTS